tara:strand:+ start:8097 stop:8798 length:702 start_codon:yes stop_codon:yes gene_type:complete
MITEYDKVVVCGMYRSGTTLQWNLLKQIFRMHSIRDRFERPMQVVKVHLDWTNLKIPKKWVFIERGMTSKNFVIYSRRDIRDVIVSFCQRKKVNLNDFRHNYENYIGFLKWIVENDNLISKEALSNKNIKIFSYEKNILGDDNLYELYKTFAGYFGVFDFFNEDFLVKFKFDNVKKYTSSLKEHESKTEYWPDHLNDGKVGKYKSHINNDELQEILSEPILKDWLVKHKYLEE